MGKKIVKKTRVIAKKSKVSKKLKISKNVPKKNIIKKDLKKLAVKKQIPKMAVKKQIPVKEPKLPDKKTVVELSPEAKQRILKILSNPFARQSIIDLAGENALEIVKTFSSSTSDEEIAKRLTIKISDVRATLNRLHSKGLVSYLREKDGETGWYSYTWMLNGEKVEEWYEVKLEEAKLKVDNENVELYICFECGPAHIHDFVAASESQFKCPNCSKNLDFLDQAKREELFNIKMKG